MLAGFDVNKSIGALPKVLTLAAAGNMDLATTSDLVTDAMTPLNLKTKDLGMFTDVLAKTSQKTNTNVQQLGQGILTVGGVATDAGLDVTALSTELGILANSGKKGAEGGTALRNILINLTAGTPKVTRQLKEMGIKVADSTGKLRPLNNILVDVKREMDGMTESQRQHAKAIIGGKENIEALNILLKGSGEQYETLNKQIANSEGAAQKMADTQNNTLTGSLLYMKSALEDVSITVGSNLAPIVRSFADYISEHGPAISETMQTAFDGIETAFGVLKVPLNWIIDNSGKVSFVVGTLTTLFVIQQTKVLLLNIEYLALVGTVRVLTAVQTALNFVMTANPIGLVVLAVAALTGGFILAYKNSKTFRIMVDKLWRGLKTGAEWSINFVIDKLNGLIGMANKAIDLVNKIPGVDVGTIGNIENVDITTEAKRPGMNLEAQKLLFQSQGTVGYGLKYANGTNYHQGGNAWVGETGEPEIVTGPTFGKVKKGSSVIGVDETKKILSGKGGIEIGKIEVNVSGASGDMKAIGEYVYNYIAKRLEEEVALGG